MSEPTKNHLPAREKREASAAQSEEKRKEGQQRRAEYESMLKHTGFLKWLTRQLANIDGNLTQSVLDDVFSLQSNEMIRKEARRQIGQKWLDELFKVSPESHAIVMDELMRYRLGMPLGSLLGKKCD